jgi:hypothetical protein
MIWLTAELPAGGTGGGNPRPEFAPGSANFEVFMSPACALAKTKGPLVSAHVPEGIGRKHDFRPIGRQGS